MKTRYMVIAVLVLLASCKGKNDKQAELTKLIKERDKLTEQIVSLQKEVEAETGKASKTALVAVEDVKIQGFDHYIEVQGKLDGDQNVAVFPESSASVTSVNVKVGDYVRKGQVLATLDAAVLKQSMRELKTNLDLATQLYNKQKALWDQKIGSEVQYLQAKSNKESLESRLSQLQHQIDMSLIKSPIDGSVEDAPLRIGQMASPAVAAFRVVNFSTIKVVADVAEAYTSKINKGDAVKIYFPDINKEIDARVDFASKYINPINRTFQIEVHLPSSVSNILKTNMITYVRVNDYKNKKAIAIPINYVQNDQKGSFVMLAVNESGKNIAKRTPVTLGLSYNGLSEITNGLKEGDKLISKGFLDLENGEAISF
jgi:RND family efflux transporter MFP subunit